MAISVIFFIAAIAIFLIWFILEFKRFRHKLLAIFLISLVLFGYFTINSVVLQRNDVDLGSVGGVIAAGKIYLSWLGSIFGNIKSITADAIHLNWSYNSSS